MHCASIRSHLWIGLFTAVVFAAAWPAAVAGQKPPAPAQSSPADAAPAEAARDPLSRATPRGTVIGFLTAGRRGDNGLAAQYLNTKLTGERAAALAHELFVVLDARMPARLLRISDDPDGSQTNPLEPGREVVATIAGRSRQLEIVLEKEQRGELSVWLFSAGTLGDVPALYDEIAASAENLGFGGRLVRTRVGGLNGVDWLVLAVGLPVLYAATSLLMRLLAPLIALVRRRLPRPDAPAPGSPLPIPVRLLLAIVAGHWLVSVLPLSLAVRQFWSTVSSLVAIGAIVWLLVLLNGLVESQIHRRFPRSNVAAAASLLRVLRRAVDVLVIFAGLLALLRFFGVDPTPALAGLGVGGIAVALAAQKTLENVIAGASLIFDQAVRVGDSLTVGQVTGTVDHIGLRSTRIRTPDRTIVSIPNGQIASASLETLSARDKFWFHPIVPLRYETTPDQLHAVVDGIRRLLDEHPLVDRESVRVRFFRLGSFSLDVDVSAYLQARDWNHFMDIQEALLFGVTELIRASGTWIAIPSQMTYVAAEPGALPATPTLPVR